MAGYGILLNDGLAIAIISQGFASYVEVVVLLGCALLHRTRLHLLILVPQFLRKGDVTPFTAPVLMRALALIRPPSIAEVPAGACAPAEPNAVCRR